MSFFLNAILGRFKKWRGKGVKRKLQWSLALFWWIAEFDRFLAERAAAAENLPPATNSTSPANRGAARRQLEKDEQENSLFAL